MAVTLCPCGRWHRTVRCPACGRPAPASRLPLWAGLGALVLLAAALPLALAAAYLVWAPARPAAPGTPTASGPAVEPRSPAPARTGPDPPPPERPTPPVADPPPAPPPPAPSPDPPAGQGRLEAEPAGTHRFRVGERFEQEVVVSRRSAYRTLGAEFATAAEYAFVSRVTVEAVRRDGGLTARQTIEDARLIACDPTLREALADALQKARGAVFTLTVGPDGVVTDLKGPDDPIRVLPGAGANGGRTLRVWSLLDADGWKELAGLTFFRCDPPPRPGRTWTRGLAHSWGPLGDWTGRTTFVARGAKDGRERIEYAHALSYRPPGPGRGGDLPFKIVRAEFGAPTAGGILLYDAARERVTAADEAFHVRGALAVSVGGSDAAVEVDESQAFRLRVRATSEPELTGRPPPRR